MKKWTLAVALLLIAGCSSSDDAQADIPTGPDVVSAIAAAGGTCTPADGRGEQACELNNVAFTLALDGWERQAADRRRACTEGWINENYRVLTDGTWVITTDHHADLEVIADALTDQGVQSDTRPYCL